ncbi:MAG: ABC transporter ATP-binding protein [Acidobacteria bacterium]|nr:ABC transporter ATP-binding protein [Acidobacteriota bacterium]
MIAAAEVSNLTRVFQAGGQDYHALRGVSLRIAPGELVMLAGPSGCGKTTLLSILGGVLRATSGSVRLAGEEISGMSEAQLNDVRLWEIGFVFQSHNLLAGLSAQDNVAAVLRMRGARRQDAAEQAAALLQQVNLAGKESKKPSELSVGEQQRVAIARALAGSPRLLLADEPTASLDAHNGQIAMDLLQTMAAESGASVLVVTHDNRIHRYADRILHMEDGRIWREEVVRGGTNQ